MPPFFLDGLSDERSLDEGVLPEGWERRRSERAGYGTSAGSCV